MVMNLTEKEINQRYQEDIFRHFEEEPYAPFLGIKLIEIGEGTATAEIEVKDHMLNRFWCKDWICLKKAYRFLN